MKILLVAPIHDYVSLFKQKEKLTFVKGQGQQGWLDALKNLGHTVRVFIYTDPIIFSRKSKVLQERFCKKFPLLSEKFKRIENKLSFLFLQNVFKNKKLLKLALSQKPHIIILSGGFTFI